MDIFEASHMITDKYSVRILVGTAKKPKSAIELSEKYGIPIAACYRKIKELERAGLLRCVERRLTRKFSARSKVTSGAMSPDGESESPRVVRPWRNGRSGTRIRRVSIF